MQGDGHGGFVTDQLVFGAGQPVDLSHLNVEFRVLAGTDPNAFKAAGQFDTDTVFKVQAPGGGTTGLSDDHFSGVASFSASAVDVKIQRDRKSVV